MILTEYFMTEADRKRNRLAATAAGQAAMSTRVGAEQTEEQQRDVPPDNS